MKVDGFVIRTAQGVVWRIRTSLPMTGFMTVVLRQTAFQVLFRKYTLSIYTVNLPLEGLTSFPCMSKKDAFAFKAYLAEQLNRTAKVSADAVQMENDRRDMAKRLLDSSAAKAQRQIDAKLTPLKRKAIERVANQKVVPDEQSLKRDQGPQKQKIVASSGKKIGTVKQS